MIYLGAVRFEILVAGKPDNFPALGDDALNQSFHLIGSPVLRRLSDTLSEHIRAVASRSAFFHVENSSIGIEGI
jgi:hypothetical protein